MIIVYTPADGEPETYDARTLRTSEASIAARTVDKTWPEIKQGLADEDLDAMRAVVWVLRKRTVPTLRFGDFDPGVDELVSRLDRREISSYVAEAHKLAATDPDVTPEQITAALAGLPDAAADREHAEAVIREAAEGPKEPAPEGTEGTQLLTWETNVTST